MKKIVIVLVVLIASMVFIIPKPFFAYAVDEGNSRGLWHFDEGTGTMVYDSSGNANNGSLYGGIEWVKGKVGKALSFDGSSGYVEVPDSDSLDVTGKLTLEAWICPRSLDDKQVIVCKYNHTSLSSSYYLGVGGALGTVTYLNKIYFALTYNGNNYYAMVSNTNLTANTWTHVAATSNGTHMSIYINGVSDKVRTYPPGNIYAGSAKLRIGCYLPEAGYGRFFDGALDEVRVAAGVVWTVDDDRVQCPNADFTAIQPAINAASSEDTIWVSEGTYREEVSIDKSLDIVGSGASTTIINGSGLTLSSPGLVKLTADSGDLELSGFAVTDAPPVGTNNVRIAMLSKSTLAGPTYTISYCSIYGTNDPDEEEDYGFYAQGGKENIVFTHNLVTQTGANNIVLELHTGSTEISHNALDAGVWGTDAIFFMTYDGTDVTTLQDVSYNVFDMATGGPFDYDHRATAVSFNSPGPAWGLGEAKFTNMEITYNTIANLESHRRGIGFWNGGTGDNLKSPIVNGNNINGVVGATESWGIDFIGGPTTDAAITYNTIGNTTRGVLFRTADCAPGAIIHYNSIAGNTIGVDNSAGPSIVDARYNWWGSGTGPFHNSTWLYMGNPYGPHLGGGDVVGDYVLYDPWLPSPATVKVEPQRKDGAVVRGTPTFGITINDLDAYWDLAGFDIKLYYDTTLLEATEVQPGAFAEQFNLTYQLVKEINNDDGLIRIAFMWNFAEIAPEQRQTPYGSGVLFTVKFSVKKAGTCLLELADVTLAAFGNSSKWGTESSIPISNNAVSGTIRTIPVMKEDVNADGRINIYDVVAACASYGSHPGYPNWNPYTDINGDGQVTILDLVSITRMYGLIYGDP